MSHFVVPITVVLLLAVPADGDAIYWTDSAAGKIQRSKLDGSDVEDLLTNLTLPQGIALDFAHSKMYWVEDDKVRRATLAGGNVQNVVTNLDGPRGIAIHLAGGKIYWTERHKVRRANLNGANVQDLVVGLPDPAPRHIALDVTHERMYWADSDGNKGQIRSANFDGTDDDILIEFVPETASPSGMALHVADSKMYWTDGTGKISRADLDGANSENVIDAGLSGPGDIALHRSAGRMYWADRFDIDRANLNGTNSEELTDGLSRGQGIALDISPPSVPPVFTTPPSNDCPGIIFCGDIELNLKSTLAPGDELGFSVYPFDPVNPLAILFTNLAFELDGRQIAQNENYIPGEVLTLIVDQTLDRSVPHTLHISGELDPAFAGITQMQVDMVSSKISGIVPEPATGLLVAGLAFGMRRRALP